MMTETDIDRTPWWARLLDFVTATRAAPQMSQVWIGVVTAVVLAATAVNAWLHGDYEFMAFMVAATIYSLLYACVYYLRIRLARRGMPDVSWQLMPRLRQQVSPEQARLLALWRVATFMLVVVVVVGFATIVALLFVRVTTGGHL